MSSSDEVASQRIPQRSRRSLVEENPHDHAKSSSHREALLGVPKDGLNLLARNAGKPLEKIVYPGAIFEIGEQRLDWNARSSENPGAADRTRISLNCRALTPIKH
jgi:hypothetical protein